MRWIPPSAIGVLAVLVGWGLVSGGVYLLAGLAWTLICASAPLLLFAFFLFRGLIRG